MPDWGWAKGFKMRKTKIVAAALTALLLATLTISAGTIDASAQTSGSEATYEVTITNNTSGQYLTPPNWAAHQWGTRIFQRGKAPSVGVAAVGNAAVAMRYYQQGTTGVLLQQHSGSYPDDPAYYSSGY